MNKKEAWNMHQPVENAAYGLATHDLWEANVAWVRECVADMQRFSDGGMYLNFPGFLEEGQGMMRDAYGRTTSGWSPLRTSTTRPTYSA